MKRQTLLWLLVACLVASSCGDDDSRPLAPEDEQLTAGEVVATIPIDPGYYVGAWMTPDGESLYLMNCHGNTVVVVDNSTRQVTDTIVVGEALEDTENLWCSMAGTPDGRYLFVNNHQTDDIAVIETSSNSLVKTVNVGTSPWTVTMASDGSYAYVPIIDDESIAVFNTATQRS